MEQRQMWLERVDAALRSQGMAAAAEVAEQALADGVEHPAVLNLAATAAYHRREPAQAVELLKRARRLAPRDPNVLNTLGVCLSELGRTDAALEAYDAAIRAAPTMAQAHYNRAALLDDNNDVVGARAGYVRSAGLDPDYLEPRAALAWLDASAGDAAQARGAAEQVIAREPANSLARMALASADLYERRIDAAGSRLARLKDDAMLSPVNRSIVYGMIGDLQDAAGNEAQAFAAYQASNDLLLNIYSGEFEAPGRESAVQRTRRLHGWFAQIGGAEWRDAPPVRPRAGAPRTHVFLVGFPRSGTTLLENVLAAHPDVVALEEKECLGDVAAPYLASPEGLKRLASLGPADAARARSAYWTAVAKFGVEPRGKVFIDKMPLSTIALPVIAKLFPDARILFAVRDPRDVVLSCFRRRFGMNSAMYEFLTLDGAAAFYAEVMALAEIYRGLLPLPIHNVRYESLVGEFRGTAAAAFEFLGLEWRDEVEDFAARARTRGISTPSAAQVVRGLNREGAGAWRRYTEQVAPVLPRLEPWVHCFGYS